MADQVKNKMDLKAIFNKMGHSLEEIRVRALVNIVSKLEHNVLCDVDLVQEKHLFIRLLEWFNFPTCPKQNSVLSLLNRLTKHPSAASIVVDIGGVEFLTQLRSNVSRELQLIIDNILDNLFHLPAVDGPQHSNECIYQHQPQPPVTAPERPSAMAPTSSYSVQDSRILVTEARVIQHRQPAAEPQYGYFEPASRQTTTSHMEHQHTLSVMAQCFKFSTFPWVALTLTDRHVLSSTNNSLQSSHPSLVISACEFLGDVVFQDFPSEVFLQRPNIIKSLVSLVNTDVASGADMATHAMKSLYDLGQCLEARIHYYQDPALYTPKHDFVSGSSQSTSTTSTLASQSVNSNDTRPSVVGQSDSRNRGDGQDGDTSDTPISTASTSYQGVLGGITNAEMLDLEDIQSSQFQQWTLPQLCTSILQRVVPTLKQPNETLILHALQLLQQVVRLLKEAILPAVLWEDPSMSAQHLTESLSEILESLSEVIHHHHHGNLGPSMPRNEQQFHRTSFIGIAALFTDLLEFVLPLQHAGGAVPEMAVGAINMLCEDHTLSLTLPAIQLLLLPYFKLLSVTDHASFVKAQQIDASMHATCQFQIQWQNRDEVNLVQLVSQAKESLESLPYHLNLQFVEDVVGLVSYICGKTSPNPMSVQPGYSVLLAVLAHPVESVRVRAYQAMCNIIKEALGVESVTKPTPTTFHAAVFVIEERVLYEILCFGMNDSSSEVINSASELMVYLLQGQLLMPGSRWQQLLDTLTPLMSLLQGYAGMDTSLGKCVMGLLSSDPSVQTGSLPLTERFRGTLRLMMVPEARLRAEAVGKLAHFLTSEDQSVYKLPLFSELDVSNLSSLLLIDPPPRLEEASLGTTVFKEEDMKKVYDIVLSESVEASVQKSATQQLALMMEDKQLHAYFTHLGGPEMVIKMFHGAIRRPEDPSRVTKSHLLGALVKILRHLVQESYSLRHQLAHDAQIYYTTFRCGLLHMDDENARRETAMLLALLLFDEMASIKLQPGEGEIAGEVTVFSLPTFITNRYKLPFKCATHHSVSPHRMPSLPEYDPLAHGQLAEMLRFAWNHAWCGELDGLLDFCSQSEKTVDQRIMFSRSQHLTASDKMILRSTHLPTALKQCLYDIQNATNHKMVSAALLRLQSYVTAARHHDVTMYFHQISWKETLGRFFLVIPSSNADEQLLAEILELMTLLLNSDLRPPEALMTWLCDLLQQPQGALLGLVKRSDPSPPSEESQESTGVRRNLNRYLMKFIQQFSRRSPYNLLTKVKEGQCIMGGLTRCILEQLTLTDAAHFYNLASLEASLLALMHITARSGWSVGCTDYTSLDLCKYMLKSLLQVISAFHVGRGGLSMSYMGRGVTRSATVCLRHLAFEMASQPQTEEWGSSWLYPPQASSEDVRESGLHWLTPLWSYRDTEVRAAGVGIAVALTMNEAYRITVTTQCQHIVGGIWGAAFSILLDQSECSLVRKEAALLLLNLTSQQLPEENAENSDDVWQGPVVHNEDTQTSLMGKPALVALLQYFHFYHEMAHLLSNFYPQPAIHPVSVAGTTEASPAASEATLTTAGSGSFRGLNLHNSQLTVSSTPASDLVTPRSQQSVPTPVQGVTHQVQATQTSTGHANIQNPAETSATSESSTSSVPEYASVATPCLVSSVCQLLGNLLELNTEEVLKALESEHIVATLISMVDSVMLEAYVSDLHSGASQAQYLVAFCDLVQLYTHILTLLRDCASRSSAIYDLIVKDNTAMKNIIRLLAVVYETDADACILCEQLWLSAMSFLTMLLQRKDQAQDTLISLTPTLGRQWDIVTGRCINILQDEKKTDSSLWMTALHFLSVLLCEEGRMQQRLAEGQVEVECDLVSLLDASSEDGNETLFRCSGSSLCQSLIKVYDTVSLRSSEQALASKLPAINALKSLLVISSAAKQTALECGLVESLCEQIRHIHLKLNMEVLQLPTSVQQNKRKTGHPLINELIQTFDLLRNFLFTSPDVKLAAYETDLSGLLHKLWSWAQMEPPLMSSMLHLLMAYTAKCPQACSSLAFTSALTSSERNPSDKNQYSSNSLVHCLIKLAQKESTSSSGSLSTLRSTFAILATLTLSQESRGILWKSNYLQEFSSLAPEKTKKSRTRQVLEELWLDLLVNLSFSTDGQNMILKINDSLSLLLEYARSESQHNQRCAVLVLRNLSFHTANKPKLLANEKIVPLLLNCITSGSEETRTISCNALYALIYNNQKAKVTVKSTQVIHQLQDAYNQLINLAELSPWQQKRIANLRDTLALLRT